MCVCVCEREREREREEFKVTSVGRERRQEGGREGRREEYCTYKYCATELHVYIMAVSFHLHFPSGAVAIPNAEFGEGLDLDIFMDNVLCFGEEESLVDCLFDPHVEDCTHADDVAVRCFVPGL